jgi:hypothetical protein
MKRLNTIGALAVLVFAVVLLGLLWLHGNRLLFSSDEGIFLDGAERMLHGQALYRDFFACMGPGSFGLQLAAFRVFGLTMWAGRVVVIFDFALQCALVFWLTARLAGRRAAWGTLALFFAFRASMPLLLAAHHRMDGAALSLASIALCIEGQERRKAWYWVVAGIPIAGAAACTPSLALFAPATLVWLLAVKPLRRFAIPYLCGVCAGSAAIAAALAATGSLLPCIRQMIWLQHTYSTINVVPYGSVIGGYRAAFGAATAAGHGVAGALALFCFALPAALPLAALLAWGLSLSLNRAERRWAADNAIPYLLGCTVLYVVTAFPRADLLHLAYVAAVPSALMAAWIVRYAPRLLVACVFGFLAVWAGIFLAQAASGMGNEVSVATPVGTLRVEASEAPAVDALLKTVHPGDSLYVHFIMPDFYFLTQGDNPTLYSELVPGMMGGGEETAALSALDRSPPAWVLYYPMPRADFLRVFPNATHIDHRFSAIEAWILREYTPVEPPLIVRYYQLYQRRTAPGRR